MKLHSYSLERQRQVITLYKTGLSFSQIARKLVLDRHDIPIILKAHQTQRRVPFTGTKAEWSRAYEKTPKGFLMRAYRNMQSRVTGVQKKGAHLYVGLTLLPREDFYEWAWDNAEFWRLFKQWTASGHDRKLTPSVNRLDTYKGYTLDNIEWLTHSVNSSLGCTSPRRKYKQSILMEVYDHIQA